MRRFQPRHKSLYRSSRIRREVVPNIGQKEGSSVVGVAAQTVGQVLNPAVERVAAIPFVEHGARAQIHTIRGVGYLLSEER